MKNQEKFLNELLDRLEFGHTITGHTRSYLLQYVDSFKGKEIPEEDEMYLIDLLNKLIHQNSI